MTKIIDPDAIDQGVEVIIDPTNKTIELLLADSLTASGMQMQVLYSFLKEEWKNDSNLIKYPFPMVAITPEQFEFVSGWQPKNDSTINLFRDGGFAIKDNNGISAEEYIGFITLGSVGVTDQIYYQQEFNGVATNVVETGAANQCIKVYDESIGLDARDFFKCFVREQGKTFAESELSSIGTTSVTYQVYRFPLSNTVDGKITHTDVEVAAAPYDGITITTQEGAASRTIGDGTYNYDLIIDAKGLSTTQVYERIQYQLRQNSDIDDSPSNTIGKTERELLSFRGDVLVTGVGVYIDNFNQADTNSIIFTDNTAVERSFPFVAAGTITFNGNLVNDPDAIYRMFYSDKYGTSDAVLVEDNTQNTISGTVSGDLSVAFTYDYDNNVQDGREANTDADVTVVAIGLGTSQHVVATGVITRSNSNNISLVSSLERNYENL